MSIAKRAADALARSGLPPRSVVGAERCLARRRPRFRPNFQRDHFTRFDPGHLDIPPASPAPRFVLGGLDSDNPRGLINLNHLAASARKARIDDQLRPARGQRIRLGEERWPQGIQRDNCGGHRRSDVPFVLKETHGEHFTLAGRRSLSEKRTNARLLPDLRPLPLELLMPQKPIAGRTGLPQIGGGVVL